MTVDLTQDSSEEQLRLVGLLKFHVLAKAAMDPFDYAVGLRNGNVIRFESAHVFSDGNTVMLHGFSESEDTGRIEGLSAPCPRGVEVRISDIVWAADAPFGS